MAGLSNTELTAVTSTLSTPRISRYMAACANDPARAIELYRWNAQISAAFLVPLHICEIALRNAIVGAIEDLYGPNWFHAGTAFERSLPKRASGYNPFQDLAFSRQGQSSAGKIIPELKFMFWISMVTARHDARLWIPYITKHFPMLLPNATPSLRRRTLHGRLEDIRRFRNRIAHHEPVFNRPLALDYSKITDVISWISRETTHWLSSFETVTSLLGRRP